MHPKWEKTHMRKIAFASLGLLLLVGTAPQHAFAADKKIHVMLKGSDEVPPNDSKGTATADFTVNTDTNTINWKISYEGLTSDALAAHIHGPAAPGANAGVVVNLAPNGIKTPLEGSATVTKEQLADLLAGKDYVNIHTTQIKSGELRGQITP
jgi:hypothetical protein